MSSYADSLTFLKRRRAGLYEVVRLKALCDLLHLSQTLASSCAPAQMGFHILRCEERAIENTDAPVLEARHHLAI